VTGIDWLTAVLGCMALLLLLTTKRNPGQLQGGLALLVAAVMFQFFRGFDMPVSGLAFSDSPADSVTVTGTVSNPQTFELKAIVIWVFERDQSGNLLGKETGVIPYNVAAHQFTAFSVKVHKAKGSSKFEVAAEGHWTWTSRDTR